MSDFLYVYFTSIELFKVLYFTVCAMCHWIGFNFWQPSKWMMSTCSVLPTPAQLWLLSELRLLSWRQSLSYLVVVFYCCLLFFPALWAHIRIAPVVSLLLPTMLQTSFALGPMCLSFGKSRVSEELFSNTIFHMNQCFPHQPSSLSSFHIHMQ